MDVKYEEFSDWTPEDVLEEELSIVARERIMLREKTKRLLIIIISFLFVANISILFAPLINEIFGWALWIVLMVFALGAIGSAKFLLQVPAAMVDTHVMGDRHH